MAIHVALLRGINVGGARRLPMTDLAALFEKAGARAVETYIQSGNVVFEAGLRDSRRIAKEIAESLSARFGGPVPVILRTAAEIAAIVAAMPFDLSTDPPKAYHVGFLDARPSAAATAALDPLRSPRDHFLLIDRELYLHSPDGVADSRLTPDYLEKTLGARCTMRNWNTVQRLQALTHR